VTDMRTRTLGWLIAATVAGGCGGNDASFELTFDAHGSNLVVAQDGDGPWQQLALDASGTATFEVTAGHFGVGRFCTTGQAAKFLFDTEAPDEFPMSCTEHVQGALVHLSGTTSPGAELWITSTTVPVDAAGAYDLTLPAGTYDLFAVLPGTPSRFLAARAVDVSADRVLDLPVAIDGIQMLPVTPTVTGADASEVRILADLNTPTAYASFGEGPTTVDVPPVGALLATDHAAIGAHAHDCGIQQPLTTTPPAFQVPAPYTASADRTHATWSADPAVAWEWATIFLSSTGTPRSTVNFFASTTWLAASGSGDSFPIVDLQALPGWTAGLDGFSAGTELEYYVARYRGKYDGDYAYCGAEGDLTW
jgi:hypothetical protein